MGGRGWGGGVVIFLGGIATHKLPACELDPAADSEAEQGGKQPDYRLVLMLSDTERYSFRRALLSYN